MNSPMVAAKLVAQGKWELQGVEVPSINSAEEVRLRVAHVGICGSDLHYFRHGAIGDQVIKYPFTLGHEGIAVVQEVGTEVRGLKPGDKVVINPAVSCGRCDQCLEGRPHTCRHLQFLGCPGQLEGCLQEYIVMPAKNCFAVSDDLFPLAVLVEPLAIALYGAHMAGSVKGKRVAVFGCGTIGLGLIRYCFLEGSTIIAATDKVPARLEAARRFGAHWVGNPDQEDIVAKLNSLSALNSSFNLAKNILEPGQFDLAFDCCGDPKALNQAISLLKPGGQLIIIGIPETNQISFDPHRLRRQEIAIHNVRRQNNFFAPAIEFLKVNRESLSSLITHHFPLPEIQTAFDLASRYESGLIKAIIDL
jgi:L-iditol 2-dehydrogenase